MNTFDKVRSAYRFWRNRYRSRSESSSIQYMMDLDLAGTTMLDIGANRGVYSYWMSKKAGKKGKVLAFEPQPELVPFLRDLKKSFRLDNLQIVETALSDQVGKGRMIRSEVGSGGAHLKSESMANPRPDEKIEAFEVPKTRLDTFFQKMRLPEISFIKCDVEGHELSVFKGAQNTIRKHHPVLLFEYYHKEAQRGEVFSFLEGLGYNGFYLHQNEKVPARQFDKYRYPKSDVHRNYIFVKNNP